MIHCPECGRGILEEDFNVSSDPAYCRNCKTNHSYAALARAEQIVEEVAESLPFRPGQPPRGIRAEAVPPYEELLRFRCYSHWVWLVCVFGALWGGGVGAFTQAMWSGGGDWVMRLFLIPFQLIGPGILLSVVTMFLGWEELRIGGGKAEIADVAIEPTGGRVNGRPICGVAIRLKGARRVIVGRNLNRERQEFAMGFLRHHIRRNGARKEGFWA